MAETKPFFGPVARFDSNLLSILNDGSDQTINAFPHLTVYKKTLKTCFNQLEMLRIHQLWNR